MCNDRLEGLLQSCVVESHLLILLAERLKSSHSGILIVRRIGLEAKLFEISSQQESQRRVERCVEETAFIALNHRPVRQHSHIETLTPRKESYWRFDNFEGDVAPSLSSQVFQITVAFHTRVFTYMHAAY